MLPTVLSLIFGLLAGALGVFKYHEVAYIARETARYASVHGGQYATQNAAAISASTLPTVNKSYLTSYAASNAFTLDTTQMQVTIQMTVITPGATSASSTETVDWDDTTDNQNRSPYSSWTNNGTTPATNVQVENLVTVQVSYTYVPGMLGFSPWTLQSTCVMPMSY